MPNLEQIQTDGAPAAIGPYSQAIKAGGWILCSGQVAIDPETQQFLGGSVRQQTQRALENLRAVLEAAGSDLNHVARCTVFLADMADFPAVNEVYATFFGEVRPARATVAVAGLPKDALVEIDCMALAR